jgi:hypothetical protein
VAGWTGGAVGEAVVPVIGSLMGAAGVSSPVLAGALGGMVAGAASGYASGFAEGYLRTGELEGAQQEGMRGLISGMLIGGWSGGGAGYRQAGKMELDPWTGRAVGKPLTTAEADGTPAPREQLFRNIEENRVSRFHENAQRGEEFFQSEETASNSGVNLNSNSATSNFGIYEIEVNGKM